MNLLLAEDDLELAQSLVERFRSLTVDRMLPGLDGLSLVRALRKSKSTPLIYLTTMSGIDDRVQGLEAGADGYLVKPFAFPELPARVRALTRRSEAITMLTVGAIDINLIERTVSRAGVAIELMPQEFELLKYLAQNANRPVTRKMLLENVWNIHFDPHTNVR